MVTILKMQGQVRTTTVLTDRKDADLLRLAVLALAPRAREECTLYSPGPGVWSWT